jgi:hypothetical protein
MKSDTFPHDKVEKSGKIAFVFGDGNCEVFNGWIDSVQMSDAWG